MKIYWNAMIEYKFQRKLQILPITLMTLQKIAKKIQITKLPTKIADGLS